MGIDLQKEIKLSDLFRRKAKETNEEVPAAPKPPKGPKEPRRPLFARKERAPKSAKPPKGKNAPRAAPKIAPAPPAVPLMRAFNLLPREEARESTARPGLAHILVALAGLLVIAGVGAGYLFMSARAADRQAQVDDLRVQLADLDVPVEEPREVEAHAARATDGRARTTALAAALGGRVPWDRVLRKVTLVVPGDVWLQQVTATTAAATSDVPAAGATPAPAPAESAPAGTSLTIVGGAESQEAVARFLARLAVIPELAAVSLQSSAADSGGGEQAYAFTILATVGKPGATQ